MIKMRSSKQGGTTLSEKISRKFFSLGKLINFLFRDSDETISFEKGEKIHADVLFEKEKYPEDLTEPGIELNAAPATRLHMVNFLEAIEKGIKPVADIEQGHISTASCILANLSMQLGGRPLIYDPLKREISGDAEATKLLQRKYRSPWIHPLLGNL